MPEMYGFLSRSESLSLTKMWFKLLRWDDTGITWSLWAVNEETFADLCDSAELSRILPVKNPLDQTLETMEILLRGIVIGFTQGQSSQRDHSEIPNTCICLGILLFP